MACLGYCVDGVGGTFAPTREREREGVPTQGVIIRRGCDTKSESNLDLVDCASISASLDARARTHYIDNHATLQHSNFLPNFGYTYAKQIDIILSKEKDWIPVCVARARWI